MERREDLNHPISHPRLVTFSNCTHGKRFPLLGEEGPRFSQEFIVDESALDTILVRQFQDLRVPAEFVDFVLDVGV